MVCCSAFGCASRTDRKGKKASEVPKKTFHVFPKDVELRDKWIKAVRRKDWMPTDRSVLCSIHFTESCFDRTSVNITRLRKNAIPTIFPEYLQQPLHKKRPPRKRESSEKEDRGSVLLTAAKNEEFDDHSDSEQKPLDEEQEVKFSINHYDEVEKQSMKKAPLERPTAYDVLRVCRTCLKIMKTEEAVPLETPRPSRSMDLYKKLTNILQMDLFPVENPCVCKNCESFINAVNDFKVTCRVNEGVLEEFPWDNRSRNMLYVVDQNELEMKYQEANRELSSSVNKEIVNESSLADSNRKEPDWDELWNELDEKGLGLSDMEDHWYSNKVPKTNDHAYAAAAPTNNCSNSFCIPEDNDLFSPAFDKYFQNVGDRVSARLKKKCRKFHQTDVGKGRVLCEFCGQIKGSKMSYKHHLKIHASGGNFLCHECKKVIAEWPSYVKHCKLEHGGFPKIFKCQLCPRRYHYKKLLESHMKLHEIENSKFRCFICKKVFNNKLNFEKHRILHRSNKITCKFCGCRFSRNSISRHIKLKHASGYISHVRSVRKIFNCDMCLNRYHRIGSLNLHKKQCHN